MILKIVFLLMIPFHLFSSEICKPQPFEIHRSVEIWNQEKAQIEKSVHRIEYFIDSIERNFDKINVENNYEESDRIYSNLSSIRCVMYGFPYVMRPEYH